MLRILGLSSVEQGLYEALVSVPPVTSSELAEIAVAHGWTAHCGSALARLGELGLVTPVGADPPRYAATPPHVAMDALVASRKWELARARQRVAALTTRLRADAVLDGGDPRMEVVSGGPAIKRRFTELARGARHGIRAFDAPPYSVDPVAPDPALLGWLRSGRSLQIIYARDGVAPQGRMALISEAISVGLQARVAEIPIKLMLVDGDVGLLTLGREVSADDEALLVHDPTLLAMLSVLFEAYWARAVPLHIRDGQAELGGLAELSATERELLPLLVSGFTDRAIAANLGGTERTVRRWMRDLLIHLDVETRFQAGYQAVLRGWVSTGEDVDRAER